LVVDTRSHSVLSWFVCTKHQYITTLADCIGGGLMWGQTVAVIIMLLAFKVLNMKSTLPI